MGLGAGLISKRDMSTYMLLQRTQSRDYQTGVLFNGMHKKMRTEFFTRVGKGVERSDLSFPAIFLKILGDFLKMLSENFIFLQD